MCPQRAPVLPVNAIVNHREASRSQSQLACAISNRSALDSLAMRRSEVRFPKAALFRPSQGMYPQSGQ